MIFNNLTYGYENITNNTTISPRYNVYNQSVEKICTMRNKLANMMQNKTYFYIKHFYGKFYILISKAI